MILSEYKFTEVPAWVRDAYLLPWARGFHGTNIAEDAFQLLRRSEAAAETGRLGRLQRWCRLGHSSLLQEYDRPPPPITTAVRQAAPSSQWFPRRLFQASACATSLTEGEVKQILHGARTPSPESFSELHFAWLAALQVGSIVDLQRAWLSLLANKGNVLKHPSLGGGLVLHTTHWGFLLWQLRIQKVAGKLYYTLKGVRDAWAFVTLTDYSGWVAGRPDVLTPRQAVVLGLGGRDGCAAGLWLTINTTPEALVKFSARHAFAGLQMPQLQKLLTMPGQT